MKIPAAMAGLLLPALLWLSACQPVSPVDEQARKLAQDAESPTLSPAAEERGSEQISQLPPPITLTPIPTSTNTPTVTPSPIPSLTPSPTTTPSPTPSPTVTPLAACSLRHPSPDDLHLLVSRSYGLSRHYEPDDLVPLIDYVPHQVTLGYDTQIRRPIARPLQQMIEDMLAAGLEPWIISGYRSYAEQQVAWNKWVSRYVEYGAQISSPPGHSEHQLGTTVDFGTPELAEIIGDVTLQFHTYFYQTRVGKWLLAHAHEYGFSLSYPAQAFDTTGFYYEPWHFRYLGEELATQLHEESISLTEWHMAQGTVPCLPDGS